MHQDSIKANLSDIRITNHTYTPEGSSTPIPFRRVTLVYLVNGVQQEMHLKATREQLGLLDIVSATNSNNQGGLFDNNN